MQIERTDPFPWGPVPLRKLAGRLYCLLPLRPLSFETFFGVVFPMFFDRKLRAAQMDFF